MQVLAGDIGGTKTIIALFEVRGDEFVPTHERVFPSKDHAGLADIVKLFAAEAQIKVSTACFGIAGPVIEGRVKTPNLPWVIDAADLSKAFSIPKVVLINDLEANAYGVTALKDSEFFVVNKGVAGQRGNAAIISPGTGLGMAGLYWDGKTHRPFASEGGHADFAPQTDQEAALLVHLRKKFNGHVSWERLLSGPGIANLYGFLLESRRGETPAWLKAEMQSGDPSAAISKAGLAGKDEICVETLELFVRLLGAQAGNVALYYFAAAGVFIGGGVPPRIIDKFKGDIFADSYLEKGRFRGFVEKIPVKVILNPKTALLGAAKCAALSGAS